VGGAFYREIEKREKRTSGLPGRRHGRDIGSSSDHPSAPGSEWRTHPDLEWALLPAPTPGGSLNTQLPRSNP